MTRAGGVRWRLLDGVCVQHDGTVVALPARRTREVAAVLALDPGRPVAIEVLIRAIWDDEPPRTARNSVQRFVADLRHQLGAAGERVETVESGYQLRLLPGDGCDHLDLADAVTVAAATLDHGGGTETARRVLGDVLPARPAPLAGLGSSAWVTMATRHLTDLVVEAHTLLLRCDLADGDHRSAVPAAKRLVEQLPLREELWEMYMRALYGARRQFEALGAYADLRRMLAEEFGQEPSEPLQELHLRMLRQDPSLSASRPARRGGAMVGTSARSRTPTFIPTFHTRLFGREQDLSRVLDAVAGNRVVTISGGPGVGKTRLAAAVAEALMNRGRRVWFAQLAHVSPGDERGAIAAALQETDEADVISALHARTGLLVLDNCEHLLGTVAPEVAALRDHCPRVTVLCTSREPLRLDGERLVKLDPLEPDGEGLALFLDRAAAAGADLGSDAHGQVSRICEDVDGLPLAIEIAATRAASLGLDGLEDSLSGHGLHLRAPRNLPTRHRTLADAIAWSYDLLDGHAQACLRALSVFRGGFTVAGADAVLRRLGLVAGGAGDVLADLIDVSLVSRSRSLDTERCSLLQTVGAFAASELERAGETVAVRRAHADWMGAIAGDGGAGADGEADADAGAAADIGGGRANDNAVILERESANWHAALRFAASQADLDMLDRLCGAPALLLLLGRADLAGVVLTVADGIPADRPARLAVAAAHLGRGYATGDRGEFDRGQAVLADHDPQDRAGIGRFLESAFLITLDDEVERATEVRLQVAEDPATPAGMSDMVLANTLYGVHATGNPQLERPGWVEAVEDIAARSAAAGVRLLAKLALAVALSGRDPDAARRWRQAALHETAPMPLLTKRIWQASTARVVASAGRVVAADDAIAAGSKLLGLLEEQVQHGYADDWTVLASSATLLAAVDHPRADDVIATLSEAGLRTNLARTIPDVGRRAVRGHQMPLDDLTPALVRHLREVVEAEGGRAPIRPVRSRP